MLTETLTKKDFFGRLQEKKIFKERLKAFKSGFRQNIAILGRPFTGKTLLVQSFLPDILAEQIVPVYVEARQEYFDFFSHRFIGSLLYQYLKLKGAKPKKYNLAALVKNTRKALPKTFEAINRIESSIKRKDFDNAYDVLLDLPRLVELDSGYQCAVIIEEFDKLAGYGLESPFSTLGKKIMAQRNTFYIVTSSSVMVGRQILAEKLQLLFGNFEVIELREFDFITSRNFLASRLHPYDISEKHARFLIGFTDGHPFYLDIISSRLKGLAESCKKRRITAACLSKALDEVLFNPLGELHQYFTNIIYRHCSNKNGVDVLTILVSLSEGNHKFQRLVDSLNYSAKSVSGVISDLENSGLVEKVGSFSRIGDLPLRFWLKVVYHRKRMDFTQDQTSRQKAFSAGIKKILADSQTAQREDLYEKMVGLFKAFKDDIVQIGQRRYRLPAFSDVAIRIIGENGPYIIGHAKGKNWICQIRERQVSEKHISDFLKDSKIGKYRFHHKILVVLNGMDENAKLLCKSSGIWVWNLKNLNLLLDLYGKYKVVLC